MLFGQARRKLGEVFHALARQKECQIIEGHLLPDHVHMCIAIPPKYPVASVIGFLKGKSAIAMARLCGSPVRRSTFRPSSFLIACRWWRCLKICSRSCRYRP